MTYHYPRPYMVDSDIKVYGCSEEFGNPSGHSATASCFVLAVFIDIFFSERYYYRKVNKFYVLLALILVILLICLVGFSRLYNGVHSLD
jgi:membrane-associated phospholipid phosphatase